MVLKVPRVFKVPPQNAKGSLLESRLLLSPELQLARIVLIVLE